LAPASTKKRSQYMISSTENKEIITQKKMLPPAAVQRLEKGEKNKKGKACKSLSKGNPARSTREPDMPSRRMRRRRAARLTRGKWAKRGGYAEEAGPIGIPRKISIVGNQIPAATQGKSRKQSHQPGEILEAPVSRRLLNPMENRGLRRD